MFEAGDLVRVMNLVNLNRKIVGKEGIIVRNCHNSFYEIKINRKNYLLCDNEMEKVV